MTIGEIIDNLMENPAIIISQLTKLYEECQKANEDLQIKLKNKQSEIDFLKGQLSVYEEKDNIINEQLKENVELRKELNEENKRCMILANNDKFKEQVIDLMALAIINYDDQLVINRYKNINEVKQCFERKVRE